MSDPYANKKNWFSLDLEMNKDPKTESVTDVIQIGAAAFNVETGEIVDKLKVYIRSESNTPVDPFIVKLTGITDEVLNTQGMSLYLGYLSLVDFVNRNDCFRKSISWGGNDMAYLKQDIEKRCSIDFTKQDFQLSVGYIDVKGFYQAYAAVNNIRTQSGMAKSMNKSGLTFQGRIHDALDDAINCSRMFTHLNRMFLNSKK